MANKTSYTNQQLAHDYLIIMSQYSGMLPYLGVKRAIEKCEVDIPSFYQQHGSLADITISGVGPGSMRRLELILEKGFEEAKRIIEEEKIFGMQKHSQDRAWPKVVSGIVTKGAKRRAEVKPKPSEPAN